MTTLAEGDNVRDNVSGASFKIGALIGRGKFGHVFHATRTDEGNASSQWPRDLALKWQPRTAGCANEGRLHLTLVHRNVVQCLASWDEGDFDYAVLEYCSRGSLFDLIGRCAARQAEGAGNPLLASAGTDGRDHFSLLLCDMVDALAFCGRMGVVHCDIKPENILVSEHWSFKLADFGLSSLVAQRGDYSTAVGARGTLAYMAPEVFMAYERGEKVHFSVWTDAYSLGLTLLQALRLSRTPILGGKEDARQFHELRRNVEVADGDHPLSFVRQALRSMLRHDKAARVTAAGVLHALSDEKQFEGSTAQSVGSLFDLLRTNVRVRAPVPSQAPPARGNIADRQLRHAGARAFWEEKHDPNATQWEWTNFSDCLLAKWRGLLPYADELRALLVPPRRDDVPMAWLDAAVEEHASLSLGDALARKLGVGPTVEAVAPAPTPAVANAAKNPFEGAMEPFSGFLVSHDFEWASSQENLSESDTFEMFFERPMPQESPFEGVMKTLGSMERSIERASEESPFECAMRALHYSPFEFEEARALFGEALEDESATELEKARSHLSLFVLFNEEWITPFGSLTIEHYYNAAARASASLLLREGDECDPVRAFEMGICHYFGVGTEVDNGRAHSLFVSSAIGGCAAGMVFLGECLFYGTGVSRDESASIAQLGRAAAMGHPVAQERVSRFRWEKAVTMGVTTF